MADELFDEKKAEEIQKPKQEPKEEKSETKAVTISGFSNEQVDSEDVLIGRYKLLQALSKEVQDGISKSGIIKESSSGLEFETLEIIPLSMFKSRILFDSENRQGGPLCRSTDDNLKHGSSSPDPVSNDECLKCRFSKGFLSPCSLVYNFPCIRPDQVGKEPLPSMLSMMKTSSNAAKKIYTFVINKIPRPPYWTYVWEILAKKRDFKKGSAFIFDTAMKRETTQTEKQWAETIFKMGLAGRKVEPEWENEVVE